MKNRNYALEACNETSISRAWTWTGSINLLSKCNKGGRGAASSPGDGLNLVKEIATGFAGDCFSSIWGYRKMAKCVPAFT